MPGVKLVQQDDTSALFQLPDGQTVAAPVGSEPYNFYSSQMDLEEEVVPPSAATETAPVDVASMQDVDQVPGEQFDTQVIQATPVGAPVVPMSERQQSVVPITDTSGMPAPTEPVVNAAPAVPTAPLSATTSQESVSTATKANKLDPKAVKALDDAVVARAKADRDLAEVQSMQAAVEAANLNELSIAQQARAEEEQLKIQQDRQAAEDRLSAIDTKIEELGSMKVEPGRVWASMDTPNKAIVVSAMLLGGLSSPFTGGSNLALDVFEKAIDRDIDAQKANINTKKGALAEQRGAYQDYLDLTKDDRAARNAVHIQALEALKTRMQGSMAATKSPEIESRAAAAIEAINQELALKRAEMTQIVTTQEQQSTSKTEPLVSSTKPLEMAATADVQQARNLGNAIQYMRELKGAAEANKDKIGPVAGRITAWKDALGISGGEGAELNQRVLSAVVEKVRAISGAATTDAEAKRIATTLAQLKDNPEAFFKKLDNEMEKLEREYDNLYKSYEGVARLPNKVVETRGDVKAKEDSLGIKRQ